MEISDSPRPAPPVPRNYTVRVANLGDSDLAREVGTFVLPALRAVMSGIMAGDVRTASNLERLVRQIEDPLVASNTSAASQTLVECLPRRVFEGAHVESSCQREGLPSEETCAVCHDDYAAGDRLVDLPCGHFFHEGCILPWLGEHDTCPVCRQVLADHQGANEVSLMWDRVSLARRGERGSGVWGRVGSRVERGLRSRIRLAEREVDALQARLSDRMSVHERLERQIRELQARRAQLQSDYRRQVITDYRVRRSVRMQEREERAMARAEAQLPEVYMNLERVTRILRRAEENGGVSSGRGSMDLPSNGGDPASEGL